MAKTNPHHGSAFEDFLKEEVLLEQVTATATKRALVWLAKSNGRHSLSRLGRP